MRTPDHTRDLNQNGNENSGSVKENYRSVNKNSAIFLPDQQNEEEKTVTKAVYLKTKGNNFPVNSFQLQTFLIHFLMYILFFS